MYFEGIKLPENAKSKFHLLYIKYINLISNNYWFQLVGISYCVPFEIT